MITQTSTLLYVSYFPLGYHRQLVGVFCLCQRGKVLSAARAFLLLFNTSATVAKFMMHAYTLYLVVITPKPSPIVMQKVNTTKKKKSSTYCVIGYQISSFCRHLPQSDNKLFCWRNIVKHNISLGYKRVRSVKTVRRSGGGFAENGVTYRSYFGCVLDFSR